MITIVRARLRLYVASSVTVKRYLSGTRSRIDIRDYSCCAVSPVAGYFERGGGSYGGVGACPGTYGFPRYICLQLSDI